MAQVPMVEKSLFLATSRMAEGPKNHWIRYQGFQIAMYNSTTLDTENRLYELELEHRYKMGCCTLLAKSITSFRNQIFFKNNPLPQKIKCKCGGEDSSYCIKLCKAISTKDCIILNVYYKNKLTA